MSIHLYDKLYKALNIQLVKDEICFAACGMNNGASEFQYQAKCCVLL